MRLLIGIKKEKGVWDWLNKRELGGGDYSFSSSQLQDDSYRGEKSKARGRDRGLWRVCREQRDCTVYTCMCVCCRVEKTILHSVFKKRRNKGNKEVVSFHLACKLVSGPLLQNHLRAPKSVCLCVCTVRGGGLKCHKSLI